MSWIPVKLSATKRQKGWHPERGWYCVSEETKTADLSQHFVKKAEARRACKLKPVVQVLQEAKPPEPAK